MGAATFLVPQGVGDIFWVYQKVSPFFDEVSFVIPVTGKAAANIEERSRDIALSWPGVKRFSTLKMDRIDDFKVERLADVLRRDVNPDKVITYGVNGWLEGGYRLEEIDPGRYVNYDVPLPMITGGLPLRGYLLVYVSGGTLAPTQEGKLWSIADWVTFIDRLCYAQGIGTSLPVVLTGASYDAPALDVLRKQLTAIGFKVAMAINWEPARLYHLLKHAWLFAGYQSGLSILADNLDVQQLIVYFPRIRRLADTWVKPRNRVNGLFSWAFMSEDPKLVAEWLKVPIRPAD